MIWPKPMGFLYMPKADAENGLQRRGLKQQLAQKLDCHPAWVPNRIKKVQAEGRAVAA